MEWIYDDGGRSNYYKAKDVGDCVCRALAIATGTDYKVMYNLLKKYNNGVTPRNGVYKAVYKKLLSDLGWTWIPCCGRGVKNTNVHLKPTELPDGVVICRLSGHLTCVIDGIIYDTYNCSRGETRKVYGYWIKY